MPSIKRTLPILVITVILLSIPLTGNSRMDRGNNRASGEASNSNVTIDKSNTSRGQSTQSKGKNTSSTTLTVREREGLLFMREEEKLARDVYLTLFDQWKLTVFKNIAKSEQKHMDAVLSLIDKYGLTDPATDVIGEYTDQELQHLYNDLMATGMSDSRNALWTGALIEETDIQDIVELMQQTDNDDILKVYANLLCGSENHLRSFVKRIEANGGTYINQVPAVAQEVDEILATGVEQCN